MSKMLIKNGKVWNGDNFLYSDILIADGKIAEISNNISENAEYVYDATGKIVSPGFVDAHIHMKGISADVFGISADLATLPFGVTSAADASGIMGDTGLLNCFKVKSCVFVCSSVKENEVYFGNAEKMMKIYGDKTVGIKSYFDTHVSEVYDIKPLLKIVEFARKNNLIVMVHCSNSPVTIENIIDALGKGDILTHAYQGSANNSSYDNFKALKKAKEKGVYIDAGMAGHVHTDFKIFKEAVEQGFYPDIISTDITKCSGFFRGGRYGMTMCMSIAKTLGMKEDDIFKAVTSTPAKALKKAHEWGYLSVGRCADIAVLDYTDETFELTDINGNNVSANSGYRCTLTIADGEVVYKD